MPTATHTPQRTCIGCRQVRASDQMVRVALGADGVPRLGGGPGRGAWLCSAGCCEVADRRKAFARAWRCQVDAEAVAMAGALVRAAMQVTPHPGTLSGGVIDERTLTTRG